MALIDPGKEAAMKALPAYLLLVALRDVEAMGRTSVNPEILQHLEVSSTLPYQSQSDAKILKDQVLRLEVYTREVLGAARDAANSPEAVVLAAARTVCWLVDQQRLEDPEEVAVLVALGLLVEADDYPSSGPTADMWSQATKSDSLSKLMVAKLNELKLYQEHRLH